MVYDEDNIVKFEIDNASGDTTIERYHDSDGDGSADVISPATEPVPFETLLLSELDPQWEAGKKLALRDASTRTIKTWIDPNGNCVVDAGEVRSTLLLPMPHGSGLSWLWQPLPRRKTLSILSGVKKWQATGTGT